MSVLAPLPSHRPSQALLQAEDDLIYEMYCCLARPDGSAAVQALWEGFDEAKQFPLLQRQLWALFQPSVYYDAAELLAAVIPVTDSTRLCRWIRAELELISVHAPFRSVRKVAVQVRLACGFI